MARGPKSSKSGGGVRPEPAARAPAPTNERPAFAHPSEVEFAQILDFYGVKWEYEPRSFPLNPNPPKDTDGRREESGRGVRELQGK